MAKENKKTKEEKQQDKIEALKARGFDMVVEMDNLRQQVQAKQQELNQLSQQLNKLAKET